MSRQSRPPATTKTRTPSAAAGRWRGFIAGQVAGLVLSPFTGMISGFFLLFAGIFLIVAWQAGPQHLVDAARLGKLTGHANGKIVESWLAVDWDPAEMGTSVEWRAFTKASPCAVVEYSGDWGAPVRRAFCGPRLQFNDMYTLHDVRELSPGVPFAFARDPSGFLEPEIRIRKSARDWLAAHQPGWPPPSDPPPQNALAALRLELDRPVDYAVAGWTQPAPILPLAVDPHQPDDAMPAGWVAKRLAQGANWFAFAIGALIGLLVWTEAMAFLFGGTQRWLFVLLTVIPLAALPYWAENLPRVLRWFDARWASIAADMLGDIDPLAVLTASAPDQAVLAHGERLVWKAGAGAYADTFGEFRLTEPEPAPTSADAALTDLAASVTAQARALSEADQIALLGRLERDKKRELSHAGLPFLPFAAAILRDRQASPALFRAAKRFLEEWTTQPTDEFDEHDAGYKERVRLWADLATVPVPEIANMTSDYAKIAAKLR
ncbi:MAG: hypothetical protein ACM3OB_03625 [Acidobacteriota bacterium]